MKDQAEKLREIVNSSNYKDNKEMFAKQDRTRIISITSGKGGVGKTNFAINLGIALSNLNYKVIVLDADIGFSNVDVILGIIPKYTIADVINGEKNILDIMIEGPAGVKIISGGSGIKEIMQLTDEKLNALANQLLMLEDYADYILVDTSAGFSKNILNLVNASDEIILITTPEPTSLTDGYAMIKTIAMNNSKVKLQVVVNRVSGINEANEVFEKLSKVTNKFLKVQIGNLGYLLDSKVVSDSVMNQNPFMMLNPNSRVSVRVKNIAHKIVGDEPEHEENTSISNFIFKLKKFIGKGGLK